MGRLIVTGCSARLVGGLIPLTVPCLLADGTLFFVLSLFMTFCAKLTCIQWVVKLYFTGKLSD